MDIKWRAVTIVVGVTLVVGWILSVPFSLVFNAFVSQAATARSASDLAGLMLAVNLGLACVWGLILGAAIAAAYVRLASRGTTLAGGEAVTGALVSLGLYLIVGGAIGLCVSATGTLLSLQQTGINLDVSGAGQVFGALLVSSILQGLVRLVAGALAAIPTAVVVSRL